MHEAEADGVQLKPATQLSIKTQVRPQVHLHSVGTNRTIALGYEGWWKESQIMNMCSSARQMRMGINCCFQAARRHKLRSP